MAPLRDPRLVVGVDLRVPHVCDVPCGRHVDVGDSRCQFAEDVNRRLNGLRHFRIQAVEKWLSRDTNTPRRRHTNRAHVIRNRDVGARRIERIAASACGEHQRRIFHRFAHRSHMKIERAKKDGARVPERIDRRFVSIDPRQDACVSSTGETSRRRRRSDACLSVSAWFVRRALRRTPGERTPPGS